MENKRSFGQVAGQVESREPIDPDLYMKIGTRVGTITAFYEHIPSVVTIGDSFKAIRVPPPVPPIKPAINDSTAVIPVIPKPPQLPSPIYDVPTPRKPT